MNFLHSRSRIWLVLAVGMSTLIGAANVSALSANAKPSRPEIQSIRTSAMTPKGAVDVTVSFSIASTNAKSQILQTQVKVGAKICTANRTVTKCTAKGVVAGKTYKILARAKNRNGYGLWSEVSIVIKSRTTWTKKKETSPSTATTSPSTATTIPGSGTTTSTLPALRKDLSKTNVLGISTVKLSKVEGISSSGVQSASVRKHAVGDVIFKTSGIVAYAQADTSSQSGSKLLAVSTTGAVSDALSSGTAVVKDFYSAPNGNVYIVFESKVALTTGGTTCLLAVIDVSTGVPTCVDSTLDSVKWGLNPVLDGGNSPIQLDTFGAVYYAGAVGSSAVLRKAKNGVITDFVNDNVSIQDFIVLSGGTVLLAGTTNSTNVRWLRRISESGSVKNLVIGSDIFSLWTFADGKVYAGLFSNDYGFRRYSVGLDALEDMYWISGSNNGPVRDSYFNTDGNISDCKGDNHTKNSSFCSWFGIIVNTVFNILGQKTFGVAGSVGRARQLWQYYPTPEKTNVTAISNVTLAQQVIATIILSGTSSTGSNILSLYDTSSKQETVVMDGSNEVEIYSMSYSQKKNVVLFTGLRFSDNKYVVGEVSLS